MTTNGCIPAINWRVYPLYNQNPPIQPHENRAIPLQTYTRTARLPTRL